MFNGITNVFKGIRPDVTPIQVITLIIGAIPQLIVVLGVHLSAEQNDSIDRLTMLAVGFLGADLGIRGVRNLKQAKTESAAALAEAQVATAAVKANGSATLGNPDRLGDEHVPDSEIVAEDVTQAFGDSATSSIAGFENQANPDELPVEDDPTNDPDGSTSG